LPNIGIKLLKNCTQHFISQAHSLGTAGLQTVRIKDCKLNQDRLDTIPNRAN